MANEDWDQIELQDDPEACTFKATIQRLKVQKEPLDVADPLTQHFQGDIGPQSIRKRNILFMAYGDT